MANEELATLYVDVVGRLDGLEKQLRRAQKESEKSVGKMNKAFNKFDAKIAKMKLSELRVLRNKLQNEFQRKIKLNVSGKSLDTTRRKLAMVEGALQGVETKAPKAANIFQSAWLRAAAAVTTVIIAVRKAFSFAKEVKNAARDAEETENKFLTVFENIQDKARSTASVLATSYGMANSTAQNLLGSTGDLLVGFGFTEDAALGLSKRVNELAVDLASFQNIEGGTERASEALTKAILGETESAKALGIVIRQDTKEFKDSVEAIQKSRGVNEKQARSIVILEEAYKQSKKAVGDFARTHDQLANQERIAKEEAKKFREEIGRNLQPTFLSATKLAIKFFRAITETDLDQTIRQLGELGASAETLVRLNASNTLLKNLKAEKGIREDIAKLTFEADLGAGKKFKTFGGIPSPKFEGATEEMERFKNTLKSLQSGQLDAAARNELITNTTFELTDALKEVADIQAQGKNVPNAIKDRANALQYMIDKYSGIIANLAAMDEMTRKNTIAQKILRGEMTKTSDAFSVKLGKMNLGELGNLRNELEKELGRKIKLNVNLESLDETRHKLRLVENAIGDLDNVTDKTGDAAKERESIIENYYNTVRFMDANYVKYREAQIQQEVDAVFRATKDKDKAEQLANKRRKELNDDFLQYASSRVDENVKIQSDGNEKIIEGEGETYVERLKISKDFWEQMQEQIQNFNDLQYAAFDAFATGFESMLDTATTGREAWQEMADTFIAAVRRMIAEWIALKVVMGLTELITAGVKLISGAPSADFGPASSALAGHSGGTFQGTSKGVQKVQGFSKGTNGFIDPSSLSVPAAHTGGTFKGTSSGVEKVQGFSKGTDGFIDPSASPAARTGGTFKGTSKGVQEVQGFSKGTNGFINPWATAPKFAAGTNSFIVPGGFPNDSYPLRVESGERVKVTPTARAGDESKQLAAINNSVQALNMNLISLERQVNVNAQVKVTDRDLELLVQRSERRNNGIR